jgi:S1-C subfamily serine protease
MAAYRHAMGIGGGKRFTIGTLAVVGALALVVGLAEHGIFTRAGGSLALSNSAIPGMTLDDDDDDRMPVVTSVRTNGQAERAGIRAGDEIASVNDQPVRDVAALRAALGAAHGRGPVALHIRRGDALWTVAIDRAEPQAQRVAAVDTANGP